MIKGAESQSVQGSSSSVDLSAPSNPSSSLIPGLSPIPSLETVAQFIRICRRFSDLKNGKLIGVHDLYGYNYVGYMIVCFLVEELGWSVSAGLNAFRDARPPGIYYCKICRSTGRCKAMLKFIALDNFVDALFEKYDELKDDRFVYPQPPEWDTFAVCGIVADLLLSDT
jgi:hypothetical protein